MPIERREITFAQSEFEESVAAYIRMSAGEFPTGRIVALRHVETVDKPCLDVEINPRNCGDQIVTARLQGPVIKEILIRFCLESNIPIPRMGTKEVHVGSGKASLRILVNRNIA